jgi:hypothetical protein
VEPGASRIVLVFCAPQIAAWICGIFGVSARLGGPAQSGRKQA